MSLLLSVFCGCLLLAAVSPGGARASFGIEGFSGSIKSRDGSTDTQAGSHPYTFATSIRLNVLAGTEATPDDNAKDVRVDVPPGVVGDPTALPRCEDGQLLQPGNGWGSCPAATQVGQITVRLEGLGEITVPVYNMIPPPGEPAQFGALLLFAPIYIDAHVRSGGDYGLSATLSNITTLAPLARSTLSLWGVPGDPAHDAVRGGVCINDPSNPANCFAGGFSTNASPRPFLTLPTSCAGPQEFRLSVDSWQAPGEFLPASFLTSDGLGDQVGFDGCNVLPFSPSLAVTPDSSVADSPTGVQVDLHIPSAGLQDPEGLSAANLKDAVVTLPAGMVVNPSLANGLGVCSPSEIGLGSAEPASCPDSSKVGSVEIDTPVLPHPLVGGVYVAQQGNNPFSSLLALYVAVADPETGVVVKLAGHVVPDPVTGQLTTTFDNNPQLPFTDLKLDFFGGPRAALVNPDACGAYTATSVLTPWSGTPAVEPSGGFEVNQGCHGPTFAPGFVAGTVNNQAGGFGALSVTFSRGDQDQPLSSIVVRTPPGLLGVLQSVPLCGEPQAALGTCGQQSLIGHTTVLAGAGPDPVSVGGQVFLTGPYKGAPFGLSIVVPAIAGPFNLGTVVVRASIAVDPHTAALTVSSDPLPSVLQGIPLQVKSVNVTVDRPGFTFNPTDCELLALNGTVTSTQGAQAQVSSAFHASNCAVLAFHPVFSASSLAKTSRQGGAALDVKIAYPTGAEANIHSVAVTLPKQLPARLSTIQQACPETVFNQNPAACDEGSMIGTGTASTPILSVPLTGPAYLVSHGGAAFPDIDVVLQGQGITLDLVGHINISKAGITSSTFGEVPDAPISSFELNLPEGPHSALSAVGSLCTEPLAMPTTITGQNGARITQQTRIKMTGCTPAKKKHKAKKHKKTKKGKKGSRKG
ncbi:MAG TPA: hypothetical protein VID29_00480 [Solirubrobacteraceae bacterium]